VYLRVQDEAERLVRDVTGGGGTEKERYKSICPPQHQPTELSAKKKNKLKKLPM
jgi:hypothetical protein